MLATLVLIAIVAQDQIPLRAAARESALQQTVLWQGDTLEVRSEQLDYLEAYDHRRERAGYVRTWQVRTYPLDPSSAPELLAVVRFLRDSPGMEALGIGYVALFLKAAPVEAIGAEVFDALGTMAERLARRASARRSKPGDEVLAAHLEVVASYGVTIRGFEREGRIQLCYEGDAFRRVLALPSTDEQRVRATLALTRPECVSPELSPVQRYDLDLWRAEVLDHGEVSPCGTALALAVQPVETWRELWLFHQTDAGWTVDILTPSANGPDLGYLEFAGWFPDGSRVLAVREARVGGKFRRSFEIIRLDTLEVEKQAERPEALTPFYRWQDPEWKRQTLALR